MKMLLILLVYLVISPGATAQSAPRNRFSAQEVRQEARYLYQTLQKAHYNLFAYTDKRQIDRAYQRLLASLTDSLTLLQVHQRFQPFVAQANIGHCRLDYGVYFGRFNQHLTQGGKVFPLEVVFDQGKAFISRNNSTDTTIQIGYELTAIDDQPMQTVFAHLFRSMPGERSYFKQAQLELFSLPGMLWYVNGPQNGYRLQTRSPDGRLHRTTVPAVTQATMPNRPSPVPPAVVNQRTFRMLDQTAYLRPGPFFNLRGGQGNDNAGFMRFIDSCFTELTTRSAKSLILDLRGNLGGDNSFSDPLVAYFAHRPFRFCSSYSLRTSQVLKAFWSKQIYQDVRELSPALKTMQTAILAHADGQRFAYSIPVYQPLLSTKRFQGKVIVLINRHSYSNATTTAAMIQDYGFGQLVGEETADVPTTYASIARFELPITRLGVDFPKGYFIRPNGSKRLIGVTPDQVAPDNPFTPEDETLQAALHLAQRTTNKTDLQPATPIQVDLAGLAAHQSDVVINRRVSLLVEGEKKGLRVDGRPGDGLVWLPNISFTNGTIEFDVRGKDVLQQSFVGVAFHGEDDKTYEAIYFRPFNFRTDDPVRKIHAVQYIAHPTYTWQKLRNDFPDKYEAAVNPAPDPSGWFHVRVEIASPNVRVFVNGSSSPALVVDQLVERSGKRLGLWVGNNSMGDFANLSIRRIN